MAPGLLNYLGFAGSAPTSEAENTAVRALPGSWYTSPDMYELERRSIFSRKWLMTTHKSRVKEAGDWVRYDIAGFNFIISRDRSGNIHAFHNICRHRAYPVVEKDNGTAKIFACRYHGWSYGLDGKLAKAPGYSEIQGFDKTQNSLFPIHVHIDNNGFIWVNLDGKKRPEVSWDHDFQGVDTQERFSGFNFHNYDFDHTWEIDANYNWKIAADNYNECYHCKTTHPDIPTVADLQSYNVKVQRAWIKHDGASTPEQIAKGLNVCATYFYPNASMNVSPHFFFTQRFVPQGPGRTTVRYEVFRNKYSSEEDFQLINQIYKRIMSEDKGLCDLAQKNINAGVFVNGEMHPTMEKGPLFFQKLVRESVTEHHKREQAAKQQIWPARQMMPETALVSQKDIDFCSGLACQTSQEGLVW